MWKPPYTLIGEKHKKILVNFFKSQVRAASVECCLFCGNAQKADPGRRHKEEVTKVPLGRRAQLGGGEVWEWEGDFSHPFRPFGFCIVGMYKRFK